MAHKPSVRAFLREQTPEPFARRNIYCGNRVFANKYELVEQYHRLPAPIAALHLLFLRKECWHVLRMLMNARNKQESLLIGGERITQFSPMPCLLSALHEEHQ